VPGIHVFLPQQQKQDVDGRDEPGHDDAGDNRVIRLPLSPKAASFQGRTQFRGWPWLVLDSHLRTEPLSQRLLVAVCRLMLWMSLIGRAKIL